MNNNRTQNSIRNIFFGITNKFVLLLLSFINRTVFIRFLSVELLGVSGLFSDILSMLSLADLGMNVAMGYSFYKPLAERDIPKITGLINFYKNLYRWIAGAVLIIGLCITPFLEFFVNTDRPVQYLKIYYVLYVLNTACSYLWVYKSSIISSDQKGFIVSEYNIIFNMIKQVLQILILVSTRNYIAYLIVAILTTLVQNISISAKANKLYPFIGSSDVVLPKDEKKSIFSNIKAMFIYKASGILLNGTDNTIISVMVGTVWVGIYSNYSLLINSLNSFIDILYSSVTASIGNVISTENKQKAYNIFQMMQSVSLILTFATTVCFGAIINEFMAWWVGETLQLDKWAVWAVVLNFYLAGVLHPVWSFREATGLYQKTKYIMLICAIINVGLSIIGAYYIGIAGVILASVVSRLLTYFWYEPRILYKEYFNAELSKFYIPMFQNFVFTIFSIIILRYVISHFRTVSLVEIIIKCMLIMFITLLMSAFIYRKTPGYELLKDKLIYFLRKRG